MFSIPQGNAAPATINSQNSSPIMGRSGLQGQNQGGIASGVPGLSPNPLAQQQQTQMLIKLLQKGGIR